MEREGNRSCLGMSNEDSVYRRIIRQFLAIYFAAYADATEIYVRRKIGSDAEI